MKKVLGVIPSRFASTRLPGKPLLLIGDIPMVVRVYLQAKKSKSLSDVIIATDDERIYQVAEQWNCNVAFTDSKHPSGTDRVEEIARNFPDFDIYVNIQGDEPFIDAEQIDLLVKPFDDYANTQISTLARKIKNNEDLFNPSLPKVVFDKNFNALYFSRSVIPYFRGEDEKWWHLKHNYYQHIGLYAFTKNTLNRIAALPPSPLELTESLEQLRWLEDGIPIKVSITEGKTLAIDTMEDYQKALTYLKGSF